MASRAQASMCRKNSKPKGRGEKEGQQEGGELSGRKVGYPTNLAGTCLVCVIQVSPKPRPEPHPTWSVVGRIPISAMDPSLRSGASSGLRFGLIAPTSTAATRSLLHQPLRCGVVAQAMPNAAPPDTRHNNGAVGALGLKRDRHTILRTLDIEVKQQPCDRHHRCGSDSAVHCEPKVISPCWP